MSIEIIQSEAIIEETFGKPGTQENTLLDQLREAMRVEEEARAAVDTASDALEKVQLMARAAIRVRERLQDKVDEELRGRRSFGRQRGEPSNGEYGYDTYGDRGRNRNRGYALRDRVAVDEPEKSDAYKGFKKLFSLARLDKSTVFLRAKLDPQEPTEMLELLVRMDIPGEVGSLALMKYRDIDIIIVVGNRSLGNVVIHTSHGLIAVHGENGYKVLKNENVSSAYVLEQTIQYVRDRA